MSNTAYAERHGTLDDPVVHETKYLKFVWSKRSITRITEIWTVESKSSDEVLGYVAWYARWRQYAFYPEPETLYNADCLQDIRDFISAQMLERS